MRSLAAASRLRVVTSSRSLERSAISAIFKYACPEMFSYNRMDINVFIVMTLIRSTPNLRFHRMGSSHARPASFDSFRRCF